MNSTKLSRFCDKLLETGWLLAVIITPLFFNVYSSRVFEPDKLTSMRAIAALMAAVWLVKLVEERLSGRRELGFTWRTPLVLPTLITVAVYLISTALSVTPRVSLFGSYQRLQGTYTLLGYVVIFLMVLQGLRTRAQVNRLITVVIINSLPISLYGLIQRNKLDPLPWGGNVTRRVASNMGNAIFVAAYLIMVVPPTLARVIESFKSILTDEVTSTREIVRSAAYIFIFLVQIIAIWYTKSRGPLVGLMAGLAMWAFLGLLALQRAARAQSDFDQSVLARDLGRGLAFGLGCFAAAGAAGALFYYVLKSAAGADSGLPVAAAGIAAALVFMGLWLTYIVNGRGWRWLWISALTTVVILAAGFFLINPGGPFHEQALENDSLNRLARVLEAESGTGKVRALIWEGALDLILPHEPITYPPTSAYPEGRPDPYNSLRPLVGYGPESMYVAYNSFYPPLLGHYESRTASPDRSHNETMDSLVITGLLGFAAYLWLFVGVFYYGLHWLGFIPTDWRRTLFFALLAVGACVAVAGVVSTVGPHFFGLAIPVGMVGAMLVYLVVYAISVYWETDTKSSDFPHFVLMTGLLSALVAHFVEINFGISIASTRTTFWAFAGLLVVLGVRLVPAPAEAAVPAQDQSASAESRRRRRRGKARGSASPRWSAKWFGVVLSEAVIAGLILGTLLFDFVTNAERLSEPSKIVWRALTVLPAQGSRTSYGALMIVSLTAVAATLLFVSEQARRGAFQERRHDWVLAALLHVSVSSLIGLGFALIQASDQVAMLSVRPQTIDELVGISDRVAGLLSTYYGYMVFTMLAGAAALSLPSLPNPRTAAHPWGAVAAIGLPVLALASSLTTNLTPIQADIVYKQADPYDRQKEWQLAIEHYKHAVDLAPREDFYYLWLGRAYLEYGSSIDDPAVRENILELAEQTLLDAREINPLNTDHSANLARMYRRWADFASDAEAQAALMDQSSQNYEMATTLSPQNAILWNEWALLHFSAGEVEEAQRKITHSMELDPEFDQTWALQADLLASQNKNAQALAAYEKALEFNPRLTEVWLRVGDMHLREGAYVSATYAYEEALAIKPRQANVWRVLGSLYVQLGRIDEAIPALEESLELAPEASDAWDVHRLLAYSYSQVGDNDTALAHAQTALEKAPENQQANVQSLLDQLEALAGAS